MNRDHRYNNSTKGRRRTTRYRNSARARNAQRNRVLERSPHACARCNGAVRHTRSCLRQYEVDYNRRKAS